MRQAGALSNALASVLPGELTDLQRNSQPPVPSVSKCAHFQLASLLLIYTKRNLAESRCYARLCRAPQVVASLPKPAHETTTMCNLITVYTSFFRPAFALLEQVEALVFFSLNVSNFTGAIVSFLPLVSTVDHGALPWSTLNNAICC